MPGVNKGFDIAAGKAGAMKGYLIEKYSYMPKAYTVNRLLEEAHKRGISLKLVGVYDCCVRDGVYCGGERLEECDFVINRYKYGNIVDSINHLARKSYNELTGFKAYVDKYKQLQDIALSACRIPASTLGNAGLNYDQIAEKLGESFVLKGLNSSQGREIFLINSAQEYRELMRCWEADKEFLVQEYIRESRGKDIRFYSIRGEVIACMCRENENDFRANVARGAKTVAYPIDDAIRTAAEEIYRRTGQDFLGIDLLLGKDSYWFCEINVMAGMEGIERASGVNVAGRVVETILGDRV